MKNKILEIIYSAGIHDTAFCEFSLVKERLLPCRALSRVPKNAATVIICAFPYKVNEEKPKNISRYAAVPDYHPIVMRYLQAAAEKLRKEFTENQFECFCDNSPIPEVFAAAAAGLGARGDNGLLITQKYGSWVFLGEIVTDLSVTAENRYSECTHCGLCSTACPKNACNTACLSAVSQKKGILQPFEASALKENNILWGCDICAEVCPMNKAAEIAPLPEFINGYRNEYVLNEDNTDRAYAWRGEGVIKRNFQA